MWARAGSVLKVMIVDKHLSDVPKRDTSSVSHSFLEILSHVAEIAEVRYSPPRS